MSLLCEHFMGCELCQREAAADRSEAGKHEGAVVTAAIELAAREAWEAGLPILAARLRRMLADPMAILDRVNQIARARAKTPAPACPPCPDVPRAHGAPPSLRYTIRLGPCTHCGAPEVGCQHDGAAMAAHRPVVSFDLSQD